MSPELLGDMQRRIQELEDTVSDINKTMSGIKIDNQKKIDGNIDIVPGIGTKFAYDKHGLIIKCEQLNQSDIPDLDIDQVKGLRKLLEDKISKSDLRSITDSLKSTDSSDDTIFTGCKINYNSNGKIISSSNLLLEDLPELHVEDISGLSDELESIKSSILNKLEDEVAVNKKSIMSAGTYVKLLVDEYGQIVSGSTRLTDDDMPSSLITKINTIEDKLTNFASKKIVDSLNTKMNGKIDSLDKSITSGTFTKVTINSQGLVLTGDKLNIRDLPELKISDITNLDIELRKRASEENVIELTETVNNLFNTINNNISDFQKMKKDINLRAPLSDMLSISNKMNQIESMLNQLVSSLPVELINQQIEMLSNSISVLEGRVCSLENIVKNLER